jgi:hypothetical protein
MKTAPTLILLLLVSSCAGQPPDETDRPTSTPVTATAAPAAAPAVEPDTGPAPTPEPPSPPEPSAEQVRAGDVRQAIAEATDQGDRPYRWFAGPAEELLIERFDAPDGFARVPVEPDTMGDWLRHVPLKPAGSQVLLHTGELKGRQDVHAAVIDMDVGKRDLQQCADAAMRLRAEYLFAADRERDICFRSVQGKKIKWRGSGFASFRKYLDKVFGIANSASLRKEMIEVEDADEVQIGDVYIEPAKGGAYGHAVTVMDVAEAKDGRRVMLLSQSYMPAQESHILLNFGDSALSPWFLDQRDRELETPEWTFPIGSLRRFAEQGCPR